VTIPSIDLKSQYQSNKHNIGSAIPNTLAHDQYIVGPELKELESELAEYIGVTHVLTCSSGTDALLLPLMVLGLKKDASVFTGPFAFFASAESISLPGATPVFVGIGPHTYNFDSSKPLGCYSDGAAVFTYDSSLYEELLALRVHDHATSGDKYDNVRIGLNARMNRTQAAVLIELLKLFDKAIQQKDEVAKEVFSLSLHPYLEEKQIFLITEAIKKSIAQ